jgi:hypothetical protein
VSPTATAISAAYSPFDPTAMAAARPAGSGMPYHSDQFGSGQYQRCRSSLPVGRTSTSMWPRASDPAAIGAVTGRGNGAVTGRGNGAVTGRGNSASMVSVGAPNERWMASSSALSRAAVGRFDGVLASRRTTVSLRVSGTCLLSSRGGVGSLLTICLNNSPGSFTFEAKGCRPARVH